MLQTGEGRRGLPVEGMDLMSPFFFVLVGFLASALWAPFLIGWLYRHGLRRQAETHRPIYRYLQMEKTGTPSMGGILVLLTLLALVPLFLPLILEIWALIFTLLLFGLLGIWDDLKKMLLVTGRFWGLRRRHIFLLQWIFALVLSLFLYWALGLETVSVPFFNLRLALGILFIPFASLVIVASSNAFNITDGIDGLSSGLLIIALSAFLVLAMKSGQMEIARFLGLWLGTIFTYLYFNIPPARFMMGDAGALSFGASLGVVALLLDASLLLPVIGGVFALETASSLIQMASRRFRNGKKVWIIAPLHYHFQARGWSEGKISMRFWLFGGLCAVLGLWLAGV